MLALLMRAFVLLLLSSVCFFVLAFTSSASTVFAQEEADGRALYARGVELARESGRCGDAVELFRQAIALRETPQRVLSLAVCLSTTDQHVDAADAFFRYLGMDGIDPESARAARAALDTELREVGVLALRVVPSSAEVSIDGATHRATGGERRIALAPGAHTIVVQAPGHEPRTESIVASAGREQALDIALAAPSRLTVRASVPDAAIVIDGAPVGRGEVTESLAPGSHLVEVRASGHAEFRQTVDLGEGEQLELSAQLTASAGDDLAESPILWTIVGLLAAGAAVGIGVGVWAADQDPAFSGEVFMALEVAY